MNIIRLRCRNFRGFRDLQTPQFGRVNVIAGPNGTGKTSIREAISLVLSGTATGCESGQGLAGLRSRDGAPDKTWQIDALVIDADGKQHTITRTDSEGPRSNRQQLVESITRVSGARARACIYAGELLRLDAKARQKLVLDLAPREAVTLPPEVRRAIQDALGEDHEAVDLATIERLHRAAYDARTAAGRDVTALGALAPPQAPEGLDQLLDDPREIRRNLVTAIERLDRELSAARAAAMPMHRDIDPERRAVQRAEASLADAQRELNAIPTADAVRARMEALTAKVREVAATNEALVGSRSKLTEQLAGLRSEEKRARASLQHLRASGDTGKCPTCDYELGTKRRQALEKRLVLQSESASREAQRVQIELDTVPEPLSAAKLETELATLVEHDGARERARRRLIEAAATHEEASAAFAAARAGATTPGDADAAAKIEPLTARIAEGRRRLSVLDEYLGALKVHAGNASARQTAEARHASLSRLIEILGPGGIRKAAGGGGLAAFCESINGHLELLGFRCDLRPVIDLEGDPLVTIGGRTVPAGMLSRSEQIRFAAAFACAAAAACGLGIVVVDDFEALDPESRQAMFATLDAAGHQVFILAVQTDEKLRQRAAQANSTEGGTRIFLFEDGELVAPTSAAEVA